MTFSIMALSIAILNKTLGIRDTYHIALVVILSVVMLGATTLSIMTFCIMILSIMALSITI